MRRVPAIDWDCLYGRRIKVKIHKNVFVPLERFMMYLLDIASSWIINYSSLVDKNLSKVSIHQIYQQILRELHIHLLKLYLITTCRPKKYLNQFSLFLTS